MLRFLDVQASQTSNACTYQVCVLGFLQASQTVTSSLLRKLTTRKPQPQPQPEPNDPSDSLLVSLDELIALAARAKAERTRTAPIGAKAATPAVWTPATMAAAAALPVPLELPARFPVKGPGAQLQPPGFVAAPKDLAALDHPVCPERRNDPLLAAIRAALLNDWHGRMLHPGASAAEGGILPLPALFLVLATRPDQQKARKWAHTLTSSGQTNILAQIANVSGRFAVCRPDGITLVQDFYAKV